MAWAEKTNQTQLRWGWAPGASISSTVLSASMALTRPLPLGPVPSPALHQTTLAVHTEVRVAQKQTSLEWLWQGTSPALEGLEGVPAAKSWEGPGAGPQSARLGAL